VDGRGVAALRAAGIAVDVAEADSPVALAARRQQAPFRALALLGRPHVTYKAAVSLDGRTAAASGDARWISSPQSRRLVHEWRARAGAVAVGIGTALHDDPLLTARDVEPPAERQPLRVVFDRRARLPLDGALARSASEAPVLVVCDEGAGGRTALEAAGVETFAGTAGDALAELGRRRIASVLLEGGQRLAGALLRDGLVDRLAAFVAPILLGDGPGLLDGIAVAAVGDAIGLHGLRAGSVGPDILLEAEVREV
jgi:diaminohydroxyphosphoribosylaminopyrimidine deaminase/5-amino-6-(5-phosphoribosylamino)uracil reductase